ncbi:MAG: hypothetical protein FIA97_05590 [Methylococcaceae bacterium]|nr:hypothetical protein [Methylococcaceae bacterium]
MGWFSKLLDKLRGDRPPPDALAEPVVEESPFQALIEAEADAQPAAEPESPEEVDAFQFGPQRMPRSTVGLFYPGGGIFLIRHPEDNRAGLICQFGSGHEGLRPLAGDWNGDGLHGIGLYEPDSGGFVLRNNMGGGGSDHQFQFGSAGEGWLPLIGDWDGDGIYGVGLYNPANSAFYLTNSFEGGDAQIAFLFGPPNEGWVPMAGDWDGDGVHSTGLYNPARGLFLLRNRLCDGWDVDEEFSFGPTGEGMQPVTGDWEGSGRTSVGVYDPEEGEFHLRLTADGGSAKVFSFGPKGIPAWPFSVIWV